MHNLEKSPGMFSDRPETTPKRLDLVVSPTCLRERESLLEDLCGLVGEVRGTSNISQVWPTPPFCPVADCPWSFGGPSASEYFTLQPDWHCLWQIMHSLWRTVRGPLADCPQCIFSVDDFSAEPLVDNSHERRTVRPLPADCPQYQISVSPEICQFSQF